jgi:uncharacterized membrane protein YfcA
MADIFPPTDAKGYLLLALALFALFYLAVLVGAARRAAPKAPGGPSAPSADRRVTPLGLFTGAVTNFFDTLGIGSYAPTTAMFRAWRMVPDEVIPGTLNVGHVLPTAVQTFIFTQLVPVEATTLIAMIIAAIVGAWLGAGVVSSWNRRAIQVGMGLCLLGAATLLFLNVTGLLPAGGEALGVTGTKLAIAVTGNFILGALMTLGIGLYAPCLIMVSLLGMNPTAGFPIMMGSCAFLMPIAAARFVRERRFHLGAALGLLIGGIPAVLLAAFIVKSLPLTAVRWLVIVVVLYTATSMLRTARRERLAVLNAAAS